MTKRVHGQAGWRAVLIPAARTKRRASRRIIGILASLLVAAASAGCSSAPVLQENLAGWQSQRDAQEHTFAHESFVLNRQVAAEAARLEQPDSLQWPDHAEPMLGTATQSRAVHQAQGRARTLERFLTHMRADPDVGATEAWFAGQIQATLVAADEVGAETAQVTGAFDRPLTMSEDTFRRIASAAAREGRVRGEALQLADLRRTAGNYYRRLGYDERSLTFDRGGGSSPVPDERLVANVESRLGWAGLRQAILQPRTCTRTEKLVSCAPAPEGSPPPVAARDQEVAPPSPDRSILPGDNIRWWEPRVRATDLLKRRPGW